MKNNDKIASPNQEFSKIRSILFPIHKKELRKFIPLTLIFFFISLNYSALRNLKDIFLMKLRKGENCFSILGRLKDSQNSKLNL